MSQEEKAVSDSPARQWNDQSPPAVAKTYFPRPGDVVESSKRISTHLPHLQIERRPDGVTRVTRIYPDRSRSQRERFE